MLSTVRNLSKSTVGTIGLVLFLILILASFALMDISSIRQNGFGLGSATLAKAGDREVTDRDIQSVMNQRLAVLRQQQPGLTLRDIESQFEPILAQLIQERALTQFAEAGGIGLSKALVDAEIANIPQARGLDGRVTEESYAAFLQAQQSTDAQFRALMEAEIYRRLVLVPAIDEVRIPTSFSTPYADSLMEQRSARFGAVNAQAYAGKVARTDAAVQAYYQANQARYTIPERRELQFATVAESRFADLAATSAEIDEVMAQGGGEFGSREERVLSAVVLPDQATANRVAAAARSGSFVEAVAPQGFSAADVSIGPQSRSDFASLTSDEVASAVFSSDVAPGSIVGPVRSPLGWHVVRVEEISREDVRSQADIRREVADALTAEKRLRAVQELANTVQNQLFEGASFAEIVAANNLTVLDTPPITATGQTQEGGNFALPERLLPLLPSAFAMQPGDQPILEPVDDGESFAILSLENVVPAAPPPLADIRAQVEADYVRSESSRLAAAGAQKVLDRIKSGASLDAALSAVEAEDGVSLPPSDSQTLRRLQLRQMGNNVPPPVQMMFRMKRGEARLADSGNGQATFIVILDRITPGSAANQIGLIDQVGAQLIEPVGGELAQQFVSAIVKDVGVTRNDEAIAASRQRIFQTN